MVCTVTDKQLLDEAMSILLAGHGRICYLLSFLSSACWVIITVSLYSRRLPISFIVLISFLPNIRNHCKYYCIRIGNAVRSFTCMDKMRINI